MKCCLYRNKAPTARAGNVSWRLEYRESPFQRTRATDIVLCYPLRLYERIIATISNGRLRSLDNFGIYIL